MRIIAFSLAASALALAACSSPADTEGSAANPAATEAAAGVTPTSTSTATPSPSQSAPPEDNVLALEGLGDLLVGKPVPAGSSFAERGAQISDTCRTVSSPDYPGVYAITEGGQVRRISVGQRSTVKLVEGIGVGATEAEVLRAFPGFEAKPHTYVEAPAKYLTQPGNDPRLRFEIGKDGRVTQVHVGLMPQLGYVEGCA